MKKKILFWCNQIQRERYNVQFIMQELMKIEPVETKIISDDVGIDFCRDVLLYSPDIIFTYPITMDCQVNNYVLAKILCGCKIICFTTEGVIDFEDEGIFESYLGYYSYPEELIDYHIFWGEKPATVIGKCLYQLGRISSKRQIKYFGYPMYERDKYFDNELFINEAKKINNIVSKYEKSVLIVTGFHTVNITRQEIRRCPDIINQQLTDKEAIDEAVNDYYFNIVEPLKEYRDEYIDLVCYLADKNPNTIFIVKQHPLESQQNRMNPQLNRYSEFKDFSNILVVTSEYPISLYMLKSKLLLHYGSTCALEAYIHHIPTVQIMPRKEHQYLKEYFLSTVKAYVDEYETVNGFCSGNIEYRTISSLDRYLYEMMNYRENVKYEPSKKIAKFILRKSKVRKIKCRDKQVSEILRKSSGVKRNIMLCISEQISKNQFIPAIKMLFYYIKCYVLIRRVKIARNSSKT